MITDEALKQQIAHRFSRKRMYLECNSGWNDIIADTDAQISALHPDYTIGQIKEKFGCLRYYIDGVPEEVYAPIQVIIRQAEDKSAITCECCGQPGKLSKRNNWLKTLCSQCFVEWVKNDAQKGEYDFQTNAE